MRTRSGSAGSSAAKKPQAGLSLTAAIVLLTLALFLAYSNSFQGAFVFDDDDSIANNPYIRQLWPLGPVLFPPTIEGRTAEGRPLVGLSAAVNYAVSGTDVWSYHVFNWLVHLGATLSLFGVVRRSLLLPKWSGRFADRSTTLAFCAAAIWGLHPLQTESVTYVIQRAESLMGLCFLQTLYCVIRGNEAHRRFWFVLAFVWCAVGMGAKEVMATAPVVVLLYERVFVFDSWKALWARRWKFYLALASTWLLLAALIIPLKGRGGSAGFGQGVTSWEYLQTQFYAIATYLRLAFVPYPLILDYGKELVRDPNKIVPSAVLVIALAVAALVALRWNPPLGFLGAWFFIILSPSSSFVPVITQSIAEHRVYLPLAGLVVLVVMTADWAWRRLRALSPAEEQDTLLLRWGPRVLVIGVLCLLGLLTWLRNLDYLTALRIWEDTAVKRPYNSRAYSSLSREYMLAGDLPEAIEQVSRGLAMLPESTALLYNRGTLYVYAGQYALAAADYSRAIELKPDFSAAYLNRGVARRRLGEFESALADFNQTLSLAPNQPLAFKNRALTYQAMGKPAQAQSDIRKFLEHGGIADKELQSLIDSLPESD